ncbi:uncharacterized protein PHACADRAFT_202232 [Phanerochaete carnosa HHB-10118-sp]|uniref:Uncharacterized protein n=1 Tax=Phanerochaete carnosa (strain HHB-10118-sp) TaxID=650164 RepID=K5VQS3_PHACS|nr:uncharacterized protein PHACADRAFT_202232 [Phanerochaete carnosa HHB-10118-sp]EKM48919.1 hypothetical protein PHACADRAFT_202232 [Phanerochaete carnosa HHB-10118-sp]
MARTAFAGCNGHSDDGHGHEGPALSPERSRRSTEGSAFLHAHMWRNQNTSGQTYAQEQAASVEEDVTDVEGYLFKSASRPPYYPQDDCMASPSDSRHQTRSVYLTLMMEAGGSWFLVALHLFMSSNTHFPSRMSLISFLFFLLIAFSPSHHVRLTMVIDRSPGTQDNGVLPRSRQESFFIINGHGSNTGASGELAQRITSAGSGQRFNAAVRSVDSAVEHPRTDRLTAISAASYEGLPAVNAMRFVERPSDLKGKMP